jgi:hypothetical protein
MTIVWRKQWIHAFEFESPWSIFEKISLANLVGRDEILRVMGSPDLKKVKNKIIGESRRELLTLSGFDLEILERMLGIT